MGLITGLVKTSIKKSFAEPRTTANKKNNVVKFEATKPQTEQQKPKSLDEIEGQYMGLMKFSAKGTQLLKKAFYGARSAGDLRGKRLEKAYMTDLLQAMIDLGYRLDAVPAHGGWVEVDTVSDLLSETTKHRLDLISKSI